MDHDDEDIEFLIPHTAAAMISRIGRHFKEFGAEEPVDVWVFNAEQGGGPVVEINVEVPVEGHCLGLGEVGREEGSVARECGKNEVGHVSEPHKNKTFFC